jgi:hypothetical protein
MPELDLKKVNAGLKSREKRTHQNVGHMPSELKVVAKKAAKLKVQVGHLEREVRRTRGAKPTKKAFVK